MPVDWYTVDYLLFAMFDPAGKSRSMDSYCDPVQKYCYKQVERVHFFHLHIVIKVCRIHLWGELLLLLFSNVVIMTYFKSCCSWFRFMPLDSMTLGIRDKKQKNKKQKKEKKVLCDMLCFFFFFIATGKIGSNSLQLKLLCPHLLLADVSNKLLLN